MPSTATTRLRLEKQASGENLNTWGGKLNSAVFDLLDEAIAGVTSKTVSGSAVLSTANYAADEARRAIVETTGSGGTLTIPAVSKLYVVRNGCSGDLTVTAGAASAVLRASEIDLVYCDGAAVRRLLRTDMAGSRLTNLADPTAAQDAATRSYVLAQLGAVSASPWQLVSGAHTATPGARLICDTSISSFTVTLPAAPANGSMVTIIDAAATFGVRPVTVARNGATIAGAAENLTVDRPAQMLTLVYVAGNWAVG